MAGAVPVGQNQLVREVRVRSSPVIDLEAPTPRRRGVPASGRRYGFAVVTLAITLLLALTGPVHSGRFLTLAWRADAFLGFHWVDGDTVYTTTRMGNELHLVSRDLATGRQRWAYRLEGSLVEAYLGRPTIFVPRFPPYPGSPATTLVLDATTARQLGSYPVPAAPLVYIADGVAVMADREPVQPASPGGFDGWREAHWVSGIDLATGQMTWRRRIAAGSSWALPGVYPWMEGLVGTSGRDRWMAVVGPDGTTEVWDLVTGTVVARAKIGPFDSWSYAVALPDVLVVNSRALPEMVLTGYDPRTMSVRWRVQLPGAPDVAAWPIECVPLVCLHSPYAIWAIDPGRGELRWHRRAVEVYPSRYAKLAALTVDGPAMLDVASGASLPLPDGWRIVEKQPLGRELVVSHVDAGRTVLGTLDLDSGRIMILDDVGHIGTVGSCHTTATHVACTSGDQVRVWRIRR